MTDLELMDTVIAPEFASVSETIKTTFLDFAAQEMNVLVWGVNYQQGKVNLAAHKMKTNPNYGGGASSGGEGAGPVKRRKAGDLEIEYAVSSSGGSMSSEDAALMESAYGKEYFRLRALLGTTPVVVGDVGCATLSDFPSW